MIELTLEQVRALAQAGENPIVIDPTTRAMYALVPAEHNLSHMGAGESTPSLAESGAAPQAPESPQETPVAPWKHLVIRRHPWRKQLYLKGRSMTVRHVVGAVKANRFSEDQAAEDLNLPVEAIREALKYFDENPEVIALDQATELYLLSLEGGRGRGPESVPR